MHFFTIMFLSLINLMINKYTDYILILQGWNTAARKHPTERESGPHCKKLMATVLKVLPIFNFRFCHYPSCRNCETVFSTAIYLLFTKHTYNYLYMYTPSLLIGTEFETFL